jgi:hypothetical protein
MIAAPRPVDVARPVLMTVANSELLELHVAVLVTFAVEPSLKVPVAVYCVLLPTATQTVAGVTEIEVSAAGVTVSSVEPLIEFTLAPIVVDPVTDPIARPVALTGATVGLEELHDALAVKSFDEPSLYVPVAANCSVKPLAIVGFAGVTAMDTRIAGVTVSVSAGLTMLPSVAVMLLVPVATPVARPPTVIVAIERFEEPHITLVVMFCVLASL